MPQVRALEGALAAAGGIVEGTVERVTFKAANGYTVLRLNAVQASGQPPAGPAPRPRAAPSQKGAKSLV